MKCYKIHQRIITPLPYVCFEECYLTLWDRLHLLSRFDLTGMTATIIFNIAFDKFI